MQLRVPHYYKDFRCIADKCLDNCCVGGWQIDIDEETVEYYKNVTGVLGDELRANLDYTDTYCFRLKDGKCPFLDKQNLCRIYKELGEEHMGVVCTQFPRFSEYYGNIKETGIGIACEEAARIILSDTRPFFLTEEAIEEEAVEDSEYDEELAKSLFLLRDKLIKMMDAAEHDINYKLYVILYISNEIQKLININDYAGINSLCNSFEPEHVSLKSADNKCYSSLDEAIGRIWDAYFSLETLNQEWEELSDVVFRQLHSDLEYDNIPDNEAGSPEINNNYKEISYDRLVQSFNSYIKPSVHEYNKLIQYYLFRYYCKAVFDHDLYGKAAMIVCNYLIIHDIEMYVYNTNKKFTFEDRMNILHIFSRDIEYSTDNIMSLYEEFLFDEVFNYENLSTICIEQI